MRVAKSQAAWPENQRSTDSFCTVPDTPVAGSLGVSTPARSLIQLQVLTVVLVDVLDVGIRLGERDGFGEGVDVGGASALQPTIHGEFRRVVGSQRRKDLLAIAAKAFAKRKGAQLHRGLRLVEVGGVEAIHAQCAGGI